MINAIRIALLTLNARFLLLLTLGGAFWLADASVAEPTPWRLGAALSYYIVVLLPVIWLTALKG